MSITKDRLKLLKCPTASDGLLISNFIFNSKEKMKVSSSLGHVWWTWFCLWFTCISPNLFPVDVWIIINSGPILSYFEWKSDAWSPSIFIFKLIYIF